MTQYCETDNVRLKSSSFVADGQNSTRQRVYHVAAANEGAALTLLKGVAPTTAIVDTIPLEAPPQYVAGPYNERTDKFVFSVNYKYAGQRDEIIDEGDESLSFDFAGANEFFRYALAQDKYTSNAREVGKALHVKSDGTIEGLQFEEPPESFTVERIFPEATVTNAWLRERFGQRRSVNNGPFRGLASGECFLSAMYGRQRNDKNWVIGYRFAVALNETGVTEIGGLNIGTTITVEGFQYVWTMERIGTDPAAAHRLIPITEGAYVATLFPKTDFSLLGVTT